MDNYNNSIFRTWRSSLQSAHFFLRKQASNPVRFLQSVIRQSWKEIFCRNWKVMKEWVPYLTEKSLILGRLISSAPNGRSTEWSFLVIKMGYDRPESAIILSDPGKHAVFADVYFDPDGFCLHVVSWRIMLTRARGGSEGDTEVMVSLEQRFIGACIGIQRHRCNEWHERQSCGNRWSISVT